MSASDEGPLSIGELARRTGVARATLRSWEERHGFPEPVRTGGRQRRYGVDDVELVRRVAHERARGLTLAGAIRAVTSERTRSESLYAALREAHPALQVLPVGVRAMSALTRAIEDECLAHATGPILFGSFQSRRSLELAGRRWRQLARTASRAALLCDFEASDLSVSPARVALPAGSAQLDEWSVVCLDPQMSVVLVGWEVPASGSDAGERRFEALLSLAPEVVATAARWCASTCADAGLDELPGEVEERVSSVRVDPGRTAELLHRFVGYADAVLSSRV